jgi:hypothetical protein
MLRIFVPSPIVVGTNNSSLVLNLWNLNCGGTSQAGASLRESNVMPRDINHVLKVVAERGRLKSGPLCPKTETWPLAKIGNQGLKSMSRISTVLL